MNAENENAINGVARAVLNEFTSKSNSLTYRQILDKHAVKISPLIPVRHRSLAWMWLNCVCQRLVKRK